MLKAKPRPIIIITALLIILALISITTTATSRLGFGGGRAGNGTFQPGQANGNFQAGGNGNGNGNFQANPNAGTDAGGATAGGNFQAGGNGAGTGAGGGGNFAGRGGGGGFNAFTILRSLGLSPQYFIYFNIGFAVIGIVLVLLSAFGVWKQKKWGLNLAMLMGLIFLIGAAPGLFTLGGRFINWMRISTTVLSVVASVPLLVYGILPSVRDLFS